MQRPNFRHGPPNGVSMPGKCANGPAKASCASMTGGIGVTAVLSKAQTLPLSQVRVVYGCRAGMLIHRTSDLGSIYGQVKERTFRPADR